MTKGQERVDLLPAVEALRGAVEDLALPLDLPGSQDARRERTALLAQLDDYVLPRLRSIDAPLLAVVGGSTGAGKSTLVNSVVGRTVSRSGVLRPTTRSPVLVHHPEDAAAFTGNRVLPALARVTGDDTDGGTSKAVRLVEADALPAGLAVLDAPDIDSVVEANRELARELLAAADLWLFVTTASRYADAVPWDLLRGAAERGASVAVVLDRVPKEALEVVRGDLSRMLREQGLREAPLFVVPETTTDDGLLPDTAVRPVRSWLTALARDQRARAIVVRRTLTGAVKALDQRSTTLVAAARAQQEARDALSRDVVESYAEAVRAVDRGTSDGTLLRGEVLARWQEFVGTGEWLRSLESSIGRLRDRLTAALRGRPAPAQELGEALQTGVEALLVAQAEDAAEQVERRWRSRPGGEALLAAHPDLVRPATGLPDRAARVVRDWQRYVLDLVRTEGQDRRASARVLSFGVNGLGVVLMLVAFSQTGGLVGAEVGIAGGTAVVAQRLLEAVFGDQAVRSLATKARRELLRRADELLSTDRARLETLLEALPVDDAADRLAEAHTAVQEAR